MNHFEMPPMFSAGLRAALMNRIDTEMAPPHDAGAPCGSASPSSAASGSWAERAWRRRRFSINRAGHR